MLQVNIEKKLRDFTLHVSFTIGAEILALFGASGAGKTMTLNCLAGLAAPDHGTIALNGRVLFDDTTRVNLPARERRVGYVFQQSALFPHLTVRENVSFGARGTKSAKGAKVEEMLDLVGLSSLATRHPSLLSGGQQQRVALARALTPQPQMLLLDEPFSALDAPTREQLRRELFLLQRRFAIPTVFVTHDLGEAYLLADKLAVIDAGEVLQVDAPGEILRRPQNLRVARAVGVKNILPGVVESRGEEGTRVRVENIALDAPPYPLEVGARVSVCVRPERVMLLRPERAGKSLVENALAGELVREMSDGANVALYFRADGARLMPQRDYDLQIELPVYIYERLGLTREKRWMVSVRKNGIHLIG